MADYEALAKSVAGIFKEHGALEYFECVGDDLNIEGLRSFRDLAGAKADETVIFAWVAYESRAARDVASQKIMEDPRMQELCDHENPIFDFERLAQGGFKVLVGE